jgi:hypothetical protein
MVNIPRYKPTWWSSIMACPRGASQDGQEKSTTALSLVEKWVSTSYSNAYLPAMHATHAIISYSAHPPLKVAQLYLFVVTSIPQQPDLGNFVQTGHLGSIPNYATIVLINELRSRRALACGHALHQETNHQPYHSQANGDHQRWEAFSEKVGIGNTMPRPLGDASGDHVGRRADQRAVAAHCRTD